MKYFLYTLSTVLALGFMCSLNSCNSLHSENASQASLAGTLEVPALLARPSDLGSQQERQKTQSTYEQLSGAIDQYPSDWDNYLKMAQLFMLEARITGEHGHYYPAALDMVDQVLSNSSQADHQFEASLLKASVLLSLHQFPEALDNAQKARALRPQNALVHGALTDAYVELGEYKKAIEMADKMVSLRPDLRSYARISYLREIHGDIEGAIEAMKLAVGAGMAGYEDLAWTRLQLGNLYERYGDLVAAENQYLIALEERPLYPFAIAAQANIHVKKGNLSEAKALLEQACSIIPEVGFYEQKAALAAQKGQMEAHTELVGEIMEMLDDDIAHGHKMGMEYASLHLEHTGEYPAALEYAQKEYKERPKNIDVNQLIASAYAKLGNWDQAAAYIEAAQRTQSQSPSLLCLAGLIQYKQGMKREGIKALRTAFSYDPFLSDSFAKEAKQILAKEG